MRVIRQLRHRERRQRDISKLMLFLISIMASNLLAMNYPYTRLQVRIYSYFQEDILLLDRVAISAGKRGLQVILKPQDLIQYVNGQCVDVIR